MAVFDTASACNAFRYRPGDLRGHYESYFVRANHGTRPLAFWIRYTVLVPRGRPDDALGELWAIYFDGERGRTVAVKERRPFKDCGFSGERLDARIGDARLAEGALDGSAHSGGRRIAWQLGFRDAGPPLLLLSERLYEGGFPKAKSLVPAPLARFDGWLDVDGERVAIDGWRGSQNHNWGERHTDRYAWGQVAGFDAAEDAFLECASARLRLGPLWTPWITPLVLRIDGEEYRCNALTTALRAHAGVSALSWRFATRSGVIRIHGSIAADPAAFVGLRYEDPTGRTKVCLNSKLARCELTVERAGRPPRVLRTATRAAFELLTDGETHGVPLAL
jgi:hypothetical protein